MKKGFTLIELLAVIVVLAVIALIAIPTISKIIDGSKKNSMSQSAVGYIEAVEQKRAINLLNDDQYDNIEEGVYSLPLDQYNIQVKGIKPEKGWIEITKEGIGRYSLVIGEYTVSYDGETKTVVKGENLLERPKVYPEYIYTQALSANFVGFPIDPNTYLGKKYIGNVEGYVLAFDSETECKAIVQSFGGGTCEYRDYYTANLEYLLAPNPKWEGYLKIKVTSDGFIESGSVCYKDGNCIDTSILSKNLEGVAKELIEKFPNMKMTGTTGQIGKFIEGEVYIQVNENAGVLIGDAKAQKTCAVFATGILGCKTQETF